MDSEKLLIGGVILIALIVALPFVKPLFSKTNQYDAVADSHKLKQLSDAVNAYGQKNGQYPPSLFYLAPDYIDVIPLTSTNKEFQYDPTTGTISNPSAPAAMDTGLAKDSKSKSRGNGGITPATDAMTGLSVANELN